MLVHIVIYVISFVKYWNIFYWKWENQFKAIFYLFNLFKYVLIILYYVMYLYYTILYYLYIFNFPGYVCN